MSLSNKPFMNLPALIDLNPIELNYYPFIISLDKYSETCNAIKDLSTKICVPSKAKYVNVMVFNMIARRKEAKMLIKHISCVCKCKSNSSTCTSNQKWNNDKS